MAKPFTANRLEELRKQRAAKEAELLKLKDQNVEPFKGIAEVAAGLDTLKPYSTGDPVRDIIGINHQLNNLPGHFAGLNERQLREAWEGADKIGRASAWVKGHVLLTMNRKYKEGAVKKFADEMGLGFRTAYNYMHLAETFPKVDPLLEPTFHFKAIDAAHGDKDKAVKLIEMAREERKENPKYSVRDFATEIAKKSDHQLKHKSAEIKTESVISKVIQYLRTLNEKDDLARYGADIKKINSLIEKINLSVKASRH